MEKSIGKDETAIDWIIKPSAEYLTYVAAVGNNVIVWKCAMKDGELTETATIRKFRIVQIRKSKYIRS